MRIFFLCSQNNDSKNYGFYQSVFSDFVAPEFPKTPSPKPARIPPQTPPAGGKSAEAGRIHSPRQIVSPCRVRFNRLDSARNTFELCPANTALVIFSYRKLERMVKIGSFLRGGIWRAQIQTDRSEENRAGVESTLTFEKSTSWRIRAKDLVTRDRTPLSSLGILTRVLSWSPPLAGRKNYHFFLLQRIKS